MYRHSLCAALCALTLALSPALALAQEPAATKPAPKTAGKAVAKKATAGAAKTITIAAGDTMRFAPATIRAKAGSQVTVVLKSTSALPKVAMAHNFVLLKSGTDVPAFATASATARDSNYISPKLKAQVLAATDMAGGGESVTVTFTAPTAPGKYTFICTFPAHFQSGMVGILVVE